MTPIPLDVDAAVKSSCPVIGGTEAEVSLVAITQAEAERIQQALFERKKAVEGTGADVTDPQEETLEASPA